MGEGQANIRRAEAADFKAVADLINRVFEIERQFIYEPPETQSSVATAMEGGTYFVAIDSQNHLIGCVYVYPRLKGVFRLAVEPSCRRKGYGQRLMAQAEKYAREAGWLEVFIGIVNFRPELLGYYRKLGYIETGEKKEIALKPGVRLILPCHLILMSKKLS